MKRANKKAHVFTLDVLIAIVILIIGLAIIFYSFPKKNQNFYFVEHLSEDVIDVLSTTYATDYCTKPGFSTANGCSCPLYKELEDLVCHDALHTKNGDMLSIMTEVIQVGYVARPEETKEFLKEMFITKKVIDENRFGFSLIYTTPDSDTPFELYNTDQVN
jgi:hypothetical protein